MLSEADSEGEASRLMVAGMEDGIETNGVLEWRRERGRGEGTVERKQEKARIGTHVCDPQLQETRKADMMKWSQQTL